MNVDANAILFVSHKKAQCGVYEFGKRISDVLLHSKRYHFIQAECSSLADLHTSIDKNKPAAIIYNYMPAVMPWLAKRIGPRLYQSNIASIKIPQIGIIHDVTQSVADRATNYRMNVFYNKHGLINSLFDYYIAADPTLLLLNPIVYKTGRLIPSYQNNFLLPTKPVIGSFGFGTPNKRFERIVHMVQQEFDEAEIRFNIPSADFGDNKGAHAKAIADNCRALVVKPGIHLTISHDFLHDNAILDFLAQNTINVFLYEDKSPRGLSSTIDYAMAVQRPIAVSDSVMFRHLFDVEPPVRVDKNNLKSIINNGFAPLQKYYDEWNAENIVREYERIIDSILAKQKQQKIQSTRIVSKLHAIWRKLLSRTYLKVDFSL